MRCSNCSNPIPPGFLSVSEVMCVIEKGGTGKKVAGFIEAEQFEWCMIKGLMKRLNEAVNFQKFTERNL